MGTEYCGLGKEALTEGITVLLFLKLYVLLSGICTEVQKLEYLVGPWSVFTSVGKKAIIYSKKIYSTLSFLLHKI